MRIIAGTHKSRTIYSPKGSKTRPTSSQLRESLFNRCQGFIEGAEFLDLFAGTGAMGLEAISRRAKDVIFVEWDRAAADCIRRNLSSLAMVEKAQVIQGDVWKTLPKLRKQFDIIFADPPYGEKLGSLLFSTKVLMEVDAFDLLKPGGSFFLEEAAEWEPEFEPLHGLRLIDSKRAGRTMLYHFKRDS